MKPSIISQYLNHQDAPKLFIRFPRILFVYFLINHLSVLRMKYSRRAIQTVLKNSGIPRLVIDAGCGMGDFLFTIPEFENADKLIGIDVSQSNIDVCARLASTLKKNNMEFICSDLRSVDLPSNADMILCISVLMCIQDDIGLLKKFRTALSENGTLVLYVAVNYRRNLNLYKTLSTIPGFDYDQIIGRPHTYTDISLDQRLSDCGFEIQKKQYSFGMFAAIMFEISAIFEWFFKSWHPIASIFLIPLYLLFYPIYQFSMIVDLYGTRNTGNGVLIIAKKT